MSKKHIPIGLTELEWETIIEGLNLKNATINDYRKVINLLHRFKNGTYRIQTISKEQADTYFSYLDERQQNDELSINTVHRYQATLRSIGTFMETKPDIWPNYKNPFSRLVRNETRARTRYSKETFANPSVVATLLNNLNKLDPQDQIIIGFMANLGMTPTQIQNLQVSCFDRRVRNPELPLTGEFDTGTFLEYTNRHYRLSPYRTGGYPVRYVKRSPNRTITWKYLGTFEFSEDYKNQLVDFYRNIGVSKDTRKFFMTQRHLEFNYRAMHHMIMLACKEAGIDSKDVTPYQLSLYGLIRSYLIDTSRRKKETVEATLALETNDARKAELNRQLTTLNAIYEKLAETAPIIGYWQDRFPIPLEIQVKAIRKQMGVNFLLEAVGIDPNEVPYFI